MTRRITRRRYLELSLGLVSASLLAACSPAAAPAAKPTEVPKPAQAAPAATAGPTGSTAFDWKRFKGETLEVSLTTSPRADLQKKHLDEFQELAGIKVNMEITPEQQARQKQVIEFTSGNTSFDVTMVSWHVQKRLFGKGRWLEPLNDMLKDPTMTAPDFDFADFSKASLDYATQSDGRIDTMPLTIDYWIVYYNKELFDAKGVKEPKTIDEMVAAAKAFHDPPKNVYGFVGRGLKNANVPVWLGFMLGWDKDSVDKDGNLQTTSPEAIEAAKVYQDLLKNYAPAGVSGFNWNESQTLFYQGNAAMWFDGSGFAPPVEDPSKSKIVGKVGYALQMAGPKAQYSSMFGDGMGISASSKKKGPAYFYLQWACSKTMQNRLLQGGGGASCRTSTYQDQQVLSNLTVPKAWADALVASSKIGRPGLPVIIPVTEFRDTFGIALTNMIGGADPRAELERATAEFKPILEKSEKG